MAFSDPIVGTEVLIRNQIQSENFSIDPENGVTGWQIKRDGTATFNQLVIGGPNFIIDENGDAVFHSITLTTDGIDQGAITMYGEDLDDVLAQKSRGIVSLINLGTSTGTSSAGVNLKVGELVIPAFDVTRQYNVFYTAVIDVGAATPAVLDLTAYYHWDAQAAVDGSDPSLGRYVNRMPASTNDSTAEFGFTLNADNLSGSGTDLNIAIGLSAGGLAGVRMFGTGQNRLWAEDIGLKLPAASWTPGGGTPPPTQYVKTYSASGSASYQGDDDIRSGVAECYQGQYSATNGNQYSVILFPYSTIASDLTGATISKIELFLNNIHWYNNSGGTAIIGYHNSATTPSSFSYPTSTDNFTQASFTYGQDKWVTIDTAIATAFKNGTAKGILLGKGPSTSKTYYGYFAGNGQSGEPQLRITYTK